MTDQPEPPKEAALFTAIRTWGITRGDNGVVGGVVEGLGDRVGLARVPARIITVVAALLLPGIVALLYAAGWALLPNSRGSIVLQDFGRGVTNVGALLGIAVLTVFGFVAFDGGPIFNAMRDTGPWGFSGFGRGFDPGNIVGFVVGAIAIVVPIAILTGLILLVVWLVRRSSNSTPPAAVPPGTPGSADAGDTDADGATAPPAPGSAPGRPQPWEPAYLPGDPRAGVTPSRGAVPASASRASAHHASAPADGAVATATLPVPVPVPVAPRRSAYVPGPGKAGYFAALGVVLICAAGVAIADREGRLAVQPSLAWFAAATVGLGVLLIIISAVGRRLGFLGFVSVMAVGVGVLLAAHADNYRLTYDAIVDRIEREFVNPPEPVVEDHYVPFDAAAAFRDDYSQVYVAAGCRALDGAVDDYRYDDTSTGVVRVGDVDDDTVVNLQATMSEVRVPVGTSLELAGATDATVVWPSRDMICDFYSDGWYDDQEWEDWEDGPAVRDDTAATTWLQLIEPGEPVVTINAPRAHSIIVIEEEI